MEVTVGMRCFKSLCDDLAAISTSTYDFSTTLNAECAASQKVLTMDNTSGFTPGETVILDPAGDDEEVGVIASIVTNTSITLEDDLENIQASGNTIRQGWYNYSVDKVRDWDLLWLMTEQIPGNVLAGALLGEETEMEFETMTVLRTQNFQAVVMKRTRVSNPHDRSNIRIYEKLKADAHKAIIGYPGSSNNYKRDGHAIDTRILATRPLDRADFVARSEEEEAMSDTAYVGCLVTGFFVVRHRVGDRTLEI
jgi:hypothetical protein